MMSPEVLKRKGRADEAAGADSAAVGAAKAAAAQNGANRMQFRKQQFLAATVRPTNPPETIVPAVEAAVGGAAVPPNAGPSLNRSWRKSSPMKNPWMPMKKNSMTARKTTSPI